MNQIFTTMTSARLILYKLLTSIDTFITCRVDLLYVVHSVHCLYDPYYDPSYYCYLYTIHGIYFYHEDDCLSRTKIQQVIFSQYKLKLIIKKTKF